MCGTNFSSFRSAYGSSYASNRDLAKVRAGEYKYVPKSDSTELLDLPSDALTQVMSFLDYKDVMLFGATCRSVFSIAESENLWMDKCAKWKEQVPLAAWREKVDSAKALFLILNAFDSVAGSWSAQNLAPRGGLLYCTWGSNTTLTGYRVIPDPRRQSLTCMPLFEMNGSRDGSTYMSLFCGGRSKPGALVWDNDAQTEFHLEYLESTQNYMISFNRSNANVSNIASPLRAGIRGRVNHPTWGNEGDDLHQRACHYFASLESRVAGNFVNTGQSFRNGVNPSTSLSNGNVRRVRKVAGTAVGVEKVSSVRRGKEVPSSRYKKLDMEMSKPGQEFAGLWMGNYGSHGLEVLAIHYTTDGMIAATKILGDNNVPCGEFSFRARLDTENSDPPPNVSDLLNLTGRESTIGHDMPSFVRTYKGEGRIAEENYRNPRWVEGQLLIDKSNKISFLWKDVNFIIQLCPLHLTELVNVEKLQ